MAPHTHTVGNHQGLTHQLQTAMYRLLRHTQYVPLRHGETKKCGTKSMEQKCMGQRSVGQKVWDKNVWDKEVWDKKCGLIAMFVTLLLL